MYPASICATVAAYGALPALMGMGGGLGNTAAATGFSRGMEGKGAANRVLIVEDEFLTSWYLSDMISGLGFEVVGISATGEDAIKLATETAPDLVLMDVSLKGKLDGIEAAQVIREAKPIAILFVSAFTDDDTVRRMEAVEGSHRIVKPVEVTGLRAALEVVLDEDSAP